MKTNEITGASLGTNQITLPAGTYYIEASSPAYRAGGHQTILYNNTTAAILVTGTIEMVNGDYVVQTRSFLSGRFTLSGTSVLEFQHRCTTGNASAGLGVASGLTTEVYSELKIWKVA